MYTLQSFILPQLILITGDLHIPQRKQKLPLKFEQLLTPNKIQHVFCTGNVGNQKHYEWLKNISPNFHCVKGQYDETSEAQPEQKFITIGQWKFLLIHGHQVIPWGEEESLNVLLKVENGDIAISGHLHDARISKLDKKYFINPGSLTGAYGPFKRDIVPEFVILEVLGKDLGIYVYHLVNNEVIIEKTVIQK